MLEAMIAGAIMLLLSSALVRVLMASYAHSQRVSGRLELNAQVLTALSHIKRELSESSLACVEVADPQALIFPSPRTATGNFDNDSGQLTYHKQVCYRTLLADGELRLVRQEEVLLAATPVPPEPLEMVPARDLPYFTASPLPARVIAKGLTRFACSLEVPDNDMRRGRIHLILGLQRSVRGRDFGVEVETSVAVLN